MAIGGVYLPGWGVCPGRVSVKGSCLSRGCLPRVGVSLGWVSAQGRCLPRGCLPGGVNTQLWTDRHLQKHYLSANTVADGKDVFWIPGWNKRYFCPHKFPSLSDMKKIKDLLLQKFFIKWISVYRSDNQVHRAYTRCPENQDLNSFPSIPYIEVMELGRSQTCCPASSCRSTTMLIPSWNS